MNRVALLILLSVCVTSNAFAVEILRWERVPLSVRLLVGQERVILIDRNVRVGMPAQATDSLRVQSADGALYLKAEAPMAATRLQLQDADTGALILIDIVAEPAAPDEAPLETIRIIDGAITGRVDADSQGGTDDSRVAPADTPIPVVLTRYAAQNLYAPLRTVEPVAGVAAVPLRPRLTVDTLLPSVPVRGQALGAWRLGEYWVTAIKLVHTAPGWLELDPCLLQGDFSAATFQHDALGPAGDPTDTTVLYLVTRGHGLAESLLPAIAPFDAAIPLAVPQAQGSRHEK